MSAHKLVDYNKKKDKDLSCEPDVISYQRKEAIQQLLFEFGFTVESALKLGGFIDELLFVWDELPHFTEKKGKWEKNKKQAIAFVTDEENNFKRINCF